MEVIEVVVMQGAAATGSRTETFEGRQQTTQRDKARGHEWKLRTGVEGQSLTRDAIDQRGHDRAEPPGEPSQR